jgi:hypothetical protein
MKKSSCLPTLSRKYTSTQEISAQNYFDRANSLRLFTSLPAVDFKYITLSAVKMNNSTPNPLVRMLLATSLIKALRIGNIPENDLQLLKEKAEEYYQQMLSDTHPYSFFGKLSLLHMVHTLISQFGDANLKHIHPHFSRIVSTLKKCNRAFISGVCQTLINYVDYYFKDNPSDNQLKAKLITTASQYLLSNNDPTTIIALESLLFHIGEPFEGKQYHRPLLRLINLENSISYQALLMVEAIINRYPLCFGKSYLQFFPNHDNPDCIRNAKFRILTKMINDQNYNQIINEISFWVKYAD